MTRRPRRILWHSDAPWATSAYAGQTRLVSASLRSAGFDVVLSAASIPRGGATMWNGFTVVPAPSHIKRSLTHCLVDLVDTDAGDQVITLIDPWRLAWQDLEGWGVLSWTAIDCDPLPGAIAEHFLASKSEPIAVSTFGAQKLSEHGFGDVAMIPHGVDLQTFGLLVADDRATSRTLARRSLGLESDSFVIGVVAANNDGAFNRKSFPEILAAVASFAGGASDITLYLHTDLSGLEDGLDLNPLLDRWLRPLSERVTLVATSAASYQRGLSDGEMALLYNAMDVLLAPSSAEGFCLPLLEAQACGVPVIASDFAAQPENVGIGRLVAGQPRWDHERGTFMSTPSVPEIVDALDDLRSHGDESWSEAVAFTHDRGHDRIFDSHWLPLLGQA